MQKKNEKEMTTASNALPSEPPTLDELTKTVNKLRIEKWNTPDYSKLILSKESYEKYKEKLFAIRKYPIINQLPQPDMYSGIDIATRENCPKHKGIMLDHKGNVVGILDFNPWWIRKINTIKKYFKSLWFKIIQRINKRNG